MKYNIFGVMLDCSRNAVMKVSEIKNFISLIAKMGYDVLELYAEDTYRIDDEPYFGYLRGGYTASELKEIDEYAKSKEVELIPCIQTLAHFTNLVKLPRYQDFVDVNDILLVDEEKTYDLIEKIFKTIAGSFSSKKVNIGMDEAHLVGLGKYLDKHGYKNRFDILLRHLSRVVKIAEKYGFTPHMWSDMFFRLIQNGEYYGKGLHLPKEIVEKIPDNIELCFWDYYHQDKEMYDEMLKAHKETGKSIWFAGGAWCWCGFAPFNEYSLQTMLPAMQSVVENSVENVLITMWGDNGKECSFYAALPALFAIRKFADGVNDFERIKNEFEEIFGYSFDDFMLLDTPNVTPKSSEWKNLHVPSKNILYSDCLLNSNDAYGEEIFRIDYRQKARDLRDAVARVDEFGYVFQALSSLCEVLEIKKDISIRTRKAYKAGAKKALAELIKDYARLEKKIQKFHADFYTLWHKENKPFGWEIHDARLGGLLMRVKTCKGKIKRYLEGKIACIEELETEILPLGEVPFENGLYRNLISVSEM